jgi:hypothetical protein
MFRYTTLGLIAALGLPLLTFAQTKYEPLIKIPGISSSLNGNFGEYVNFLYALAISVAALIAVVKIIVAGMKYMMSEVVTTKGDAKKEITNSLLGLLLILGAYIILYTINPQLTNQTIKFKDLPPDPHINTPPSIQTTTNPDGSINVDGAPKDASGNLLKPVIIHNGMACYGNWCPQTKYASWTGTVFSYKIEQQCNYGKLYHWNKERPNKSIHNSDEFHRQQSLWFLCSQWGFWWKCL